MLSNGLGNKKNHMWTRNRLLGRPLSIVDEEAVILKIGCRLTFDATDWDLLVVAFVEVVYDS